jgi:exopolysaccharide biosynthesis polyprenyl glycosylphosphotransferase
VTALVLLLSALTWNGSRLVLPSPIVAAICLLSAIAMLLLVNLLGLYDLTVALNPWTSSKRVMIAWGATMAPLAFAVSTSQLVAINSRSTKSAVLFLLASSAILVVTRVLAARAGTRLHRAGKLRQDVILLADAATVHTWRQKLHDRPEINVVGAIIACDDDCDDATLTITLRAQDDLSELLRSNAVDAILVPIGLGNECSHSVVGNVLPTLPLTGFVIFSCSGITTKSPKTGLWLLGKFPLLPIETGPLRGWRWIAKDLLERLLAAVGLIIVLPLMLVAIVGIKIGSPGPVFFRQIREGYHGREFQILKFRTMHCAAPGTPLKLTANDDPRVFPFGSLLRKTSADELPQLFNVIRGDMWLVGPRPHPYWAKAGDRLYRHAVPGYAARQQVKPGITGWAQVNGWRGPTVTAKQIEERVKHDLHYIENWSFSFDFRIILRTIVGGFTGDSAF